jgi:hypothetical protein
MKLTFAERYRQARLYAAQVRVRRAMGDKYRHASPWRGPDNIKSRRLQCVTLVTPTPGALTAA